MGEEMGPQMHQGGWTNKKGGGSRHSPPSQFPRITPLSVKGEGEKEGGGWTEPGQIYVHTYQGIGRVNIKIEIHTVQSSCQILSSNITTPHALGEGRW